MTEEQKMKRVLKWEHEFRHSLERCVDAAVPKDIPHDSWEEGFVSLVGLLHLAANVGIHDGLSRDEFMKWAEQAWKDTVAVSACLHKKDV